MKKQTACSRRRTSRPRRGRLRRTSLVACSVASASTAVWSAANTNLTWQASVTVKETYDSNVYLQDYEPSPLVPAAVRPFQESFVTSVTPKVGMGWRPIPEFGLSASYAPEVVLFHAEPTEDHVSHRTALNFSGKVKDIAWEQFNSFTWIDGTTEGLTFGIVDPVTGRPAGAPAIGGIPIRDRREALIYRNGFGAYHPLGPWFFRPTFASYIHDFRTTEKDPRNFPFYQNYVDRNDLNVGVDVGYAVYKEVHAVVGYRFGYQMEPPLPGSDIDYSNHYHRVIAGLEGDLTAWFKLKLGIGPAYHDFDHSTPGTFDGHQLLLYVDSSAVLTPTVLDTITLTVKQFMQPAFGAPSAYEDITYDVVWQHDICNHSGFKVGFRAYAGDWLDPVQREDWIYTASAGFDLTINKHLSAAVTYSYDWAESMIPNTEGRNFTRHLAGLSAAYKF